MKMKRLLAFALAGTLSLSNVAWAENGGAKTEVTAEAESRTKAETENEAEIETSIETGTSAATVNKTENQDEEGTGDSKAADKTEEKDTKDLKTADKDENDTKDSKVEDKKEENAKDSEAEDKETEESAKIPETKDKDAAVAVTKKTLKSNGAASSSNAVKTTDESTEEDEDSTESPESDDERSIETSHILMVKVLADGSEKVVNLAGSEPFKTEAGLSVKLGSLSDEVKKYFVGEPVSDGMSVRFKLKPSTEAFQADIPFTVIGEGYTEDDNAYVLSVLAQPRVPVESGVFVETRTEKEIRNFYNSHTINLSGSDSWGEEPDPAGEVAGKLKAETVENALNALNFVRYVAGISSDVTNNPEYEEAAQAGTTLLQRIGELMHEPEIPDGMSQEFFDLGFSGTKSSNIAEGYRNLAQAVIEGWMHDGDEGNIDRIGHRRWCLNPFMKETGFGHSGEYMAMYSHDNGNQDKVPEYDYVPWPAQTMPVEYFQGPWSISLKRSLYDVENLADAKVTMTCNDKTYTLNINNTDKTGKYFTFDVDYYGYGPALIFQPGVSFKAGDKVSVKVSGLKDIDGNELLIEYSVTFFSMEEKTPEEIKLEKLNLNTTEKSLKVGETCQLKATLVPSNATDYSVSDVKWSTSNKNIASVSSNGLVTANAEGTATITATLGGKTAACTITVTAKDPDKPTEGGDNNKPSEGEDDNNKPSEGEGDNNKPTEDEDKPQEQEFKFSEDKVSISVGAEKILKLNGAGSEDNIEVTSSHPDIAKVSKDSNGNITVYGQSAGAATITAQWGQKEAKCTVDVQKSTATKPAVTSIMLKTTDIYINPGKTYQLDIITEPAGLENDAKEYITWSSNNPEAVTVDKNGKVTVLPNASTDALITAAFDKSESICRVLVKQPRTLTAQVLADGNEKVLNLAESGFFKENDGVKSIKVKALSEEMKKYFDGTPSVSGMTVRFKLKPSAQGFQADIPLAMTGDHYTELNNDCVLKISAQPQIFVDSRTETEIRNFFKSHTFSQSGSDSWDVNPDKDKVVAGKLSAQSVTNGLNALNFVRYVAGIPSNVTNNKNYEEAAQAGTTLLLKIGKGLDHKPKKPAGVSQEFYDLGLKGTKSSNLGMGYVNLAKAVIGGWMEDGDADNIDCAGHRRWCLNPFMKETGFGHSGSYTAMYSYDEGNKAPDYNYVPWPGQTMPVNYFEGPWSISLNRIVYDSEKSTNVTVTMTCNGKTYTLNNSTKDKSGKYFNFDKGGYGYGSALIFQPGVSFKAGDKVSVKVSGLKDQYGNELPIEYSVKFFAMEVKALEGLRLNTASATVKLNDTYQLKATLVPSNATEYSVSDVKWSSSNKNIASVNNAGLVTANAVGTAKITATLGGKTATCTITVKRTISSGSSGSSSSGGGGGSYTTKSYGSSSSSSTGGPSGSGSVPSYVVSGTWSQNNGTWKFTDASGNPYKSKWAAVSNPYANTAAGQASFDWFFFDAAGNMLTGWYLDTDGNYYYLNPDSDGTKGRMLTGWVWIPDASGVKKCYYLNPVSDGTRGKMVANTVVEGYTVNAQGEWVVNGVVQTK